MVGIFTKNLSIFDISKQFLNLKNLKYLNYKKKNFNEEFLKILRFSNSRKNSFFFHSVHKNFSYLVQKKLDKREFLFLIDLNLHFFLELYF